MPGLIQCISELRPYLYGEKFARGPEPPPGSEGEGVRGASGLRTNFSPYTQDLRWRYGGFNRFCWFFSICIFYRWKGRRAPQQERLARECSPTFSTVYSTRRQVLLEEAWGEVLQLSGVMPLRSLTVWPEPKRCSHPAAVIRSPQAHPRLCPQALYIDG